MKKIITNLFMATTFLSIFSNVNFVSADETSNLSDNSQAIDQKTDENVVNDNQNNNSDVYNDTSISYTAAVTNSTGGQVYNFNDSTNSMKESYGKRFGNNSAWHTDVKRTMNNGETYYRISTNEWLNSKEVSLQNVNNDSGNNSNSNQTGTEMTGNAYICYINGYSVHLFNGYGSNATYSGKDLPNGSGWKVIAVAVESGKRWYEIGDNAWVSQDYVTVENANNYERVVHLDVPLISQRPELPNGCEITAVTMMINYAGNPVDKMTLAREMPRSSNPNYGYIGNPWDNTGITIFPPALMGLVSKYTPSHTAQDLTGYNFDTIKYQLSIGHPVVTWNTMHGFPYHALTITGYDTERVYYNDCWTNEKTSATISQFVSNWNTQNRRAISY